MFSRRNSDCSGAWAGRAVGVGLVFLLTARLAVHSDGAGTHTLDGPVGVRWEQRLDAEGTGDEFPAAAVLRSDEALLFAAGTGTPSAEHGADFLTLAFDALTGAVVWTARYNGTASLDDGAVALALSADGSLVFVAGQARGDNDLDLTIVAYAAGTGEPAWTAVYDGPAGGRDIAAAICVQPTDGMVFVTGSSAGIGTGPDFVTLALHPATGALLWDTRVDGPISGTDFGQAIACSGDGERVVVTGESAGDGTGADALTILYDAATGDEVWRARYDGPAHRNDRATTVAFTPDGAAVLAAGRSEDSAGRFDFFIVAYDTAGGAVRWQARYNGPADGVDFARALVVAPDGGRVFVTGPSVGFNTGFDFATIAYDTATGARLWVARYNGPASGDDNPHRLDIGQRGDLVVVTGDSVTSGNADFCTIALDAATGALRWTARFDSPDQRGDTGRAVLTTADEHRHFVVGESKTPTGERRVAALAYENLLSVALREPAPNAVLSFAASAQAVVFEAGPPAESVTLWGRRTGIGEVVLDAETTPDPETGEYLLSWDALVDCAHEGAWTLWAVVEDADTNSAQSADLSVTVDNTTFPDVDCTHFAWRFIEAVARNGIAAGFGDGTYRPNNSVTRGQMAVFMARAADLELGDFAAFSPPPCGSETFPDVDCTFFAYKFVEYIVSKGIASGFGDGTYKPGQGVTRGQMAVFLSRVRDIADGDFAGFVPPDCGSETFPDVDCTHFAYKFIEYIVSKGITAGFGDGTYKPANIVTRAQMAVFITRAADLPF